MKEWLKQNQRPIAIALLLLALYVLHFFPALESERELIVGILGAFGFFGTVAVPSFARIDKPTDGGAP